jgi:hypothetical protein
MVIAILYPLLAQIVLTFVLLLAMGWARRGDLVAGKARYADVAVDSSRYSDASRKYANCYSNQFELPVIFYVLCIVALMTAKADFLMVILAWAFVVTRVLHALIHTGSNIVPRRAAMFAAGMIILMIMTAILIIRLLTGA